METTGDLACPVCKHGRVVDSRQQTRLVACWLCRGTAQVNPTRYCRCGLPGNEQLPLADKKLVAFCGGLDCWKAFNGK